MSEEETFTTTIHLGNEAMQTPLDVARALRRIADKLDADEVEKWYLGTFQTIHDDNGNDVGRWKYGYADRVGTSH